MRILLAWWGSTREIKWLLGKLSPYVGPLVLHSYIWLIANSQRSYLFKYIHL
jgi:hypothetical protein